MKAMILAAGLGTRLKPYSLLRPKPLFPLLDRPLLLYTVERLQRSGFGPVVVNAHHLGDQIAALLHDAKDVILQPETEILGTGGGLRLALRHFDRQPVLVTNGDICHDIDPAWVYHHHRSADAGPERSLPGPAATLVLHDCPRFNTVAVDAGDRIVGFGDAVLPGAGPVRRLAFTGIHVIDPLLLEAIPPSTFYNIIDCYQHWIRKGGTIRALVVKDHFWTDMGTPSDYLELHGALLKGRAVLPGSGSGAVGPFFVAESAVMGQGVRQRDWTCIGSNARVGKGASLARVVVWDGAEVAPGAELSDTIVV